VAEELRQTLKVNAELSGGSNGIFDVIVDGEKVFSKDETGRFPNPGEITQKLKG